MTTHLTTRRSNLAVTKDSTGVAAVSGTLQDNRVWTMPEGFEHRKVAFTPHPPGRLHLK
jgi:hypothetical protein